MLAIKDIDVSYGDLSVLRKVSLEVGEKTIVALIGPNGAGKTTTLRTILGLLKPTRGAITFQGQSITDMATHDIVNLGLYLVPEWHGTFSSLTVLENLELGAFPHKARAYKDETMNQVYDLFPRLAERHAQKAGTLSGGERQMLAIGRALMSKPELLILDEPSLGLAPIIIEQIFEIIQRISRAGMSILVVEQHIHMALEIAQYAYIIESGRIVQHNSAAALLNDERVKEAYIGM